MENSAILDAEQNRILKRSKDDPKAGKNGTPSVLGSAWKRWIKFGGLWLCTGMQLFVASLQTIVSGWRHVLPLRHDSYPWAPWSLLHSLSTMWFHVTHRWLRKKHSTWRGGIYHKLLLLPSGLMINGDTNDVDMVVVMEYPQDLATAFRRQPPAPTVAAGRDHLYCQQEFSYGGIEKVQELLNDIVAKKNGKQFDWTVRGVFLKDYERLVTISQGAGVYRRDLQYVHTTASAVQGGNACVNICEDIRSQHKIAKKTISLDKFRVEEVIYLMSFSQGGCRHIPVFYGVSIEDDYVNIWMECVDKIFDDRLICCFDVQQTSRLLLQALEGLIFIHNRSVRHFDIKPSNIGIKSMNEIVFKFLDFGTAAGDMDNFVFNGMTPEYLAPEMYRRQKSDKADVWALACCIIFMMTRNHVWHNQLNSPHSPEMRNLNSLERIQLRFKKCAKIITNCTTEQIMGYLPRQARNTDLWLVLECMLQVDPAHRCSAAQAHRFLVLMASEQHQTDPEWLSYLAQRTATQVMPGPSSVSSAQILHRTNAAQAERDLQMLHRAQNPPQEILSRLPTTTNDTDLVRLLGQCRQQSQGAVGGQVGAVGGQVGAVGGQVVSIATEQVSQLAGHNIQRGHVLQNVQYQENCMLRQFMQRQMQQPGQQQEEQENLKRRHMKELTALKDHLAQLSQQYRDQLQQQPQANYELQRHAEQQEQQLQQHQQQQSLQLQQQHQSQRDLLEQQQTAYQQNLQRQTQQSQLLPQNTPLATEQQQPQQQQQQQQQRQTQHQNRHQLQQVQQTQQFSQQHQQVQVQQHPLPHQLPPPQQAPVQQVVPQNLPQHVQPQPPREHIQGHQQAPGQEFVEDPEIADVLQQCFGDQPQQSPSQSMDYQVFQEQHTSQPIAQSVSRQEAISQFPQGPVAIAAGDSGQGRQPTPGPTATFQANQIVFEFPLQPLLQQVQQMQLTPEQFQEFVQKAISEQVQAAQTQIHVGAQQTSTSQQEMNVQHANVVQHRLQVNVQNDIGGQVQVVQPQIGVSQGAPNVIGAQHPLGLQHNPVLMQQIGVPLIGRAAQPAPTPPPAHSQVIPDFSVLGMPSEER